MIRFEPKRADFHVVFGDLYRERGLMDLPR